MMCSLFLCSYECGTLEYYNRQFDKVTVKNTIPLQKFKRVFHKVTTTDDPYIEKVRYVQYAKYMHMLHSLIRGATMHCNILYNGDEMLIVFWFKTNV